MSDRRLEVLDQQPTPLGLLTLWRRRSPSAGGVVHEMKIDGEYLMSSSVHASEVALASLALALAGGERLAVLVGGLGLGHTAAAVLDDRRVDSLTVVELLAPVIDWHRRGLVPLGPRLVGDARCRLVEGDFFGHVAGAAEHYDLVLVDIDHSPDELLRPEHGAFYTADAFAGVGRRLRPGGLFALWSADPPPAAVVGALGSAFGEVWIEDVRFDNPQADTEDVNRIVFARSPA